MFRLQSTTQPVILRKIRGKGMAGGLLLQKEGRGAGALLPQRAWKPFTFIVRISPPSHTPASSVIPNPFLVDRRIQEASWKQSPVS